MAGCKEYADFDAEMHGIFTTSGFRLLLEHADLPPERLAEALSVSRPRRFVLSFRECAAFTDATAMLLADSLPPTIQTLRLEIVDSGATTAGGRMLLDGIMDRLELPQVRCLFLCDMMLEGCSIPAAIGRCVSLHTLDFAGNQMVGPLPTALGGCVSLRSLKLQNNRFAGEIPGELGQCPELEEIALHRNQLTGRLPEGLALCTKLHTLTVDPSLLEGGLPPDIQARRDSGQIFINRPRRD